MEYSLLNDSVSDYWSTNMELKLSMMSYTMARQPEHFSLEGMLELTKELNLSGIDFVTLHDRTPKDLRGMCDDLGIPIVAHTFMASLNDATKAGLQEAVDSSKWSLEDAVALGAPLVMIPTPGKKDEDRDEARKRWIAGLAEVAPFAEGAGVVLTVENFPGLFSPFVTADDFYTAKREIPTLRLTYDNGNVAGGEDPAESFRRCADDVVHVHFKDWYIRDDEAEGHVPMLDGRHFKSALIGEGDIDQKACLEAMKASGYEGCVNIEYEGNDYTPDEAVRRAADHLREIWATLP